MARYRIANISKQEGVISLKGKWETIPAGTVRYVDFVPGEHTPNLRVQSVAQVSSQVGVQVAKPKNVTTTKVVETKKEDK